jgi:hypothetical protein
MAWPWARYCRYAASTAIGSLVLGDRRSAVTNDELFTRLGHPSSPEARGKTSHRIDVPPDLPRDEHVEVLVQR